MGNKGLDWLFKYSNLSGSAKWLYDLFLGLVAIAILILFVWLMPNSNVVFIGIKIILISIVILYVLLFKMDTTRLLSLLCFKPCTIKNGKENDAWEAINLFFASLLFLCVPIISLTWAAGIGWAIVADIFILLVLYGLFRYNVGQYLT